jgi:hypothetical protein
VTFSNTHVESVAQILEGRKKKARGCIVPCHPMESDREKQNSAQLILNLSIRQE